MSLPLDNYLAHVCKIFHIPIGEKMLKISGPHLMRQFINRRYPSTKYMHATEIMTTTLLVQAFIFKISKRPFFSPTYFAVREKPHLTCAHNQNYVTIPKTYATQN